MEPMETKEVFFQWSCRGPIRSHNFFLRMVGAEVVAGCWLIAIAQQCSVDGCKQGRRELDCHRNLQSDGDLVGFLMDRNRCYGLLAGWPRDTRFFRIFNEFEQIVSVFNSVDKYFFLIHQGFIPLMGRVKGKTLSGNHNPPQ